MSTAALPITPASRHIAPRLVALQSTGLHVVPSRPAARSTTSRSTAARSTATSQAASHHRAILVRRAVLVAVVIGLGLAAALLIRPAAAASDAAPATHTHTQTIVVGDGQSLWSIAVDAAGSEDPRDVVMEISEMNGLSDSVVHPGQRLEVPAR